MLTTFAARKRRRRRLYFGLTIVTNTHRTCAHAAARPPWRRALASDSPASERGAAQTCIHPSVVLVPRTNIAAWVQALGRLCIVVTGACLEMCTYQRLQMCPSPRSPSLLAVWPALLFYGGRRGLRDGCRAQARTGAAVIACACGSRVVMGGRWWLICSLALGS
ncbi:hypothetical protein C8J57DRAFT_1307214 [Mycena rebaudengoi]|nr:hypothetical protein C8J57DRAFT_1307214 [Mycena rebaudengoi]